MTTLRLDSLVLPAARLGDENPLPVFRGPTQDLAVPNDGTIAEEDARHLGWRCAYRVAPYRVQDEYDRDKQPRPLRVAVLENEHLRATFALAYGGRLLSLHDKTAGRELLDRNPVFQPANLALRNAWFSGGVEFNAGQFGHTTLTCAPVFAARVRGSQGEPVLRIYEWERAKCFPYQVDFHLPPGSRFLFSRVRLVNPTDRELPMYWWTNIAVSETAGTRVLCPVDSAIGGVGPGRFGLVPVPVHQGIDVTYARNMAGAREFFFRIPDGQRRWEAAVEADGKGLVHTSTARLCGRKVFYWGMNQGGRRWQEFLSQPGRSYIEIQAGLARTQIEHVPMPAHVAWEWTEAFGGVDLDPKKTHGEDWGRAWRSVDDDLAARLPAAQVDALDQAFAAVTARAADELLASGSGWGALERRRLAAQKRIDRIPAELDFGQPGADQQPWLELLERGALPAADTPGQFMVQPEWQSLLEAALTGSKGDHWLSWWHLGTMRMENLDATGAKAAWDTSLQRRRTGWTLRNLAILTARASRPGGIAPTARPGAAEPPSPEAAELLAQAWEAGPRIAPLAIEFARMLLNTGQHRRLLDVVAGMPEAIRGHERIRMLAADAAVHLDLLDHVAALFDQDFATICEGEVALTDLWFRYHERRIAAAEGIAIDEALRKRVRAECPPPRHIDFRV